MNLFMHLIHNDGVSNDPHHQTEDANPEKHHHHEDHSFEGSEFLDDAIRMTDQPLQDE